jgi:hypothetical protein
LFDDCDFGLIFRSLPNTLDRASLSNLLISGQSCLQKCTWFS